MRTQFFRTLTGFRNRLSPAQVLVLGFFCLIIVGALLLSLPLSSSLKKATPIVDALFTATSAICVTGLIVIDPGTHFSLFGQLVLLTLIQIGGLGYMTMSTLLALLVGKRITFRDRLIIRESLQSSSFAGLVHFVLFAFKLTIVLEAIGALLLAFRFVPQYGWAKGLYFSIFHSISAFCNAGFSLFSTNFMNYRGDWLVVSVISFLIIIGGIGYIVINDICLNRRWHKFSLHSKVVLITTGLLILGGTILIYLLEIGNPEGLPYLSLKERILSSFFQAVTPRTAGFNTLNIGSLSQATLLILIILMFIGASPGGTGGGVKTTTVVTVLNAIWSALRGKTEIQVLYRRLAKENISRSFILFSVALLWLTVATFFLLLLEKKNFINILFEATSAFATVGLSTGVPESNLSLCSIFSTVGKIILIVTMFIGRVGLLTVGSALVEENEKTKIRYVEERILIG